MTSQPTTAANPRHVAYMPLGEVTPAPRNPKRHNLSGIRQSIGRFGFTTPALLDERTGRLVAGHGRLAALTAMREAGEQPPAGVRPDGDTWLVPVIRGWASRSDTEAEAYLVADNRHTELGGWDDAELAALLAAVGEVDPDLVAIAGYDDADLAKLLGQVTELPEGLTDPDDIPGTPTVPVTVKGDLWLLGEHRLLCGDATNPDDVDRALGDLTAPGIVYTDPPYGISIVDGNGKIGSRSAEYLPVAGDETSEVAADAFRLLIAAHPDAVHIWWGSNHYAASAGMPNASCWLVWNKVNVGNVFADAELAWTNYPGAVRLLEHQWQGFLRATERGKRVHPTQKPVALAEWAFGVVDPRGERTVVLDAFAGSGSTLIAAYRTQRTAALIELEPHYVDVICRRWQDHVGEKPILEATGQPHDFTRPAR